MEVSSFSISPKLGAGIVVVKKKKKRVRGPDDAEYDVHVPDYVRTRRGRKGLEPPTEAVGEHVRRTPIC